jgi:hypothetical protein
MLPYAVVPAAACVALVFMVDRGIGAARREGSENWAKNLKTWFERRFPTLRVDVAVSRSPLHWLGEGRFTLVNPLDSAIVDRSPAGCWKSLVDDERGSTSEDISVSTCSRRRARSPVATAW